MEGGNLIKNIERNYGREEVFQFSHENAVLDAIHPQQFKIGLPLALAKLLQQNSLEISKRVIGLVAGINCIQNILVWASWREHWHI
jgi:hypothetical protein